MNVSCKHPLPWLPKLTFLLQIYVENKVLLYLFMVEPLTKEQSQIRQTTCFLDHFHQTTLSMNTPLSPNRLVLFHVTEHLTKDQPLS